MLASVAYQSSAPNNCSSRLLLGQYREKLAADLLSRVSYDSYDMINKGQGSAMEITPENLEPLFNHGTKPPETKALVRTPPSQSLYLPPCEQTKASMLSARLPYKSTHSPKVLFLVLSLSLSGALCLSLSLSLFVAMLYSAVP